MIERGAGPFPTEDEKASPETAASIEIRLHGLEAERRPSDRMTLATDEPIRLGELVARLAREIDMPNLADRIEAYHFALIVNGVNARQREMWDTTLLPGDVVAIILPRAGG